MSAIPFPTVPLLSWIEGVAFIYIFNLQCHPCIGLEGKKIHQGAFVELFLHEFLIELDRFPQLK
jgi:hypothetical protein